MPDQTPPSPAPATPAPAAANIVVTPQPLAPKTAVEQASEAARQRLANGQPLDPSAAPAAPAQPHHAATQNRAPDGRFSQDAFREVGAGVPTDDGTPAPQAGHDTPAGDPAPEGAEGEEEGQEPQAGAEGQEGQEGQEGGEGEGGEEVDEAALTVALPGRRPDDEAYEMVADSPESAERLRQLVNAAMRGDEAREYVARETQQLAAERDAITIDPAGYLMQTYQDQPEVVAHVALALLSRPEVWQSVGERVLQWDDPDRFELDQAKIGQKQYEMRDQLRQAATERAQVQQNLQDVRQAVTAMMPAEMTEDQQGAFYRDAMRDLMDYANRHNLLTISVGDIPLLLAQRLAAYNINPLEAAHRAATGAAKGHPRPAPASGNPAPSPAPKSAPTPAAPKPKTGQQFVQASKRRARAASVAPAGAGAPSNAPVPPAGQSIEQRIAWHRQQAQARRRPM